MVEDGLIKAYQNNIIIDIKNEKESYSNKRIEEFFKTESKASQLMNPFIIKPLLRAIKKHDPRVLDPLMDRLVSILVSINCLFIGNFNLKQQTWELIVTLLESWRARLATIDPALVTSLLNLKVISYIFKDFED